MKTVLVAVIVSLLTVFAVERFAQFAAGPDIARHETAYQRVMRSHVLRCGWFVEQPYTNYDANTDAHTGIVPDIVNRFAEDYGVKVEWVTISNFAMMGEDLKEGKYDAICASLIDMPRGGLITSADAFAYAPIYGYVKRDEARITSLNQLNDPAYRIAGQEGGAILTTTRQKFPKAQFAIIPSAELSEMLTSVVAGKADVAFMLPTAYGEFARTNPDALKPLNNAEPLQIFRFAFGLVPEEDGLKNLFNDSLHRIQVTGELATIFKKWDPSGQLIYPTFSLSTPDKN